MVLLVLSIYMDALQHIFLKKVIADLRGTLNMNGEVLFSTIGILACTLGACASESVGKAQIIAKGGNEVMHMV